MTTPAQVRATNKYNSKSYDALTIRIRKDGGDEITAEEVKTAADSAGESLNSFILQPIRERMNQLR